MDKKRNKRHLLSLLHIASKESPIITDPQGCYTGRPIEVMEEPVQDADDL